MGGCEDGCGASLVAVLRICAWFARVGPQGSPGRVLLVSSLSARGYGAERYGTDMATRAATALAAARAPSSNLI